MAMVMTMMMAATDKPTSFEHRASGKNSSHTLTIADRQSHHILTQGFVCLTLVFDFFDCLFDSVS